ncbi:response regulator [Arundinibacter roseus]|uniref:Response regulator n=1 Tax=Arundinibacter roseus TaxID=2070510 RepID=A0A4R4K1H7_9BACT|nr:response regulator [Arundinibacter roseus]TDB61154.1 response regulator [Arundinibacter roseus]
MLLPQSSASKSKIFLVDDDEDDRFLFLDAINEYKSLVDCEQFTDGEMLMSILSNAETLPDAIFLDLNLPKCNGIECLDYVRQRLGNHLTKVYIISTSSSPRMIETTKAKGATLYIRKPDNFGTLKNLIGIAVQQIFAAKPLPFYLNELVDE